MQSIITNINSTFHDLVGWDLLPETILNTSALPSDSEAQRCAMRISLHLLGKKRPAQTEMTRRRCSIWYVIQDMNCDEMSCLQR